MLVSWSHLCWKQVATHPLRQAGLVVYMEGALEELSCIANAFMHMIRVLIRFVLM